MGGHCASSSRKLEAHLISGGSTVMTRCSSVDSFRENFCYILCLVTANEKSKMIIKLLIMPGRRSKCAHYFPSCHSLGC